MIKLKNMKFSRFNIILIVQILLIGVTTGMFAWTFSMKYMLITQYSLLTLWFIQLFILIKYINKITHDLEKFLQSIKYKDTTFKFSNEKKGHFKEIHKRFDEIIQAFGDVRIEKEHDSYLFKSTIEHMKTGIIAFDEQGKVELFNRAAIELLGIKTLVNIRSLNTVQEKLPLLLEKLNLNQSELIQINTQNGLIKISLNATLIKIGEKKLKLVSLQNITNELEQEEMDAWQKLIKIITHEIFNSVSPITLMSSGLINQFEKNGKAILAEDLDNDKISNSLSGLKVIQNRSKSLSAFVEEYSSSMQIPAPKFKLYKVKSLFEGLSVLFNEEFTSKKIQFRYYCNEEDCLMCDQKLIEQILINLINNAIHFRDKMRKSIIELKFKKNNQNKNIIVTDNGKGIKPEIISQIFIPFFSTKDRGTGIGLSLSRQIMRLHKGKIFVQSKPDIETSLVLEF